MNNAQLTTALSLALRKPEREVSAFLEAYKDTILTMLRAREQVVHTNFGTYYTGKFSERIGRNPRTGAAIFITSRKLLRLRPARSASQSL